MEDLLERARQLGVEVPASATRLRVATLVANAERALDTRPATAESELHSRDPDRPDVATALPSHRIRSLGRVSPGKTTAVRVFLFIAGGLGLAAATAQINEILRFTAWWEAPAANDLARFDELTAAESLTGTVILAEVLSLAILVILLMVWANSAYKDVVPLDARGRTWGPGWAIGGWFIPVANLFIPKLVLNEVDRLSHPGNTYPVAPTWRQRPLIGTGTVWWVAFAVGGLTAGIGNEIAAAELETAGLFDPGRYRLALWLLTAGLAAQGAGALAGARYFRELGERFHR